MRHLTIFINIFLFFLISATSQEFTNCDSIAKKWISHCCINYDDTVLMLNGVGGKRFYIERDVYLTSEKFYLNYNDLEIVQYVYHDDRDDIYNLIKTNRITEMHIYAVEKSNVRRIFISEVVCVDKKGIQHILTGEFFIFFPK